MCCRLVVGSLILLSLLACGGGDTEENPPVVIVDENASTNSSANATPSPNTATNSTTPTPNSTSPNTTPGPNHTTPNSTTPNSTTPQPSDGISRFSLVQVGLEGPQVAFDASGTAHLILTSLVDPSHVVYGVCAASCGAESSWKFAEIFNGYHLADPRLIVAPSGEVHLLFEAAANVGTNYETIYATCASGCEAPSRWQQVNLTQVLGGATAAYRGAPFVRSETGALSFITTGGNLPGGPIVLAQCEQGCTSADNWRAGGIRDKGLRAALTYSGAALHLMIDNEQGAIVYRSCASGECTSAASWSEETALFAHNFDGAIAFGASDGELRVLYNQGDAAANESDAVRAQDRRLLFWTCKSGCQMATSWQGMLLPAGKLNDGWDNAMSTIGAVTVVAYPTDDLTLQMDYCERDCMTPGSWKSVALDDTLEMAADVDPYTVLCGGASRPLFAGWYPGAPSVAINPRTGSGLVAHQGKILRQCAGINGSVSQYMMGRVIAIE